MKLQRLRELALGVECWPHTNKTIFPSPAYDFQQACTPANILPILESYEELLRIIKACDDLDCFSDLEPADMFDIKQAITNAEKLK